MRAPTLAANLGTTTHLSALLQKVRRLGLGPKELEKLAVQRGAVTTRPAPNLRGCWPVRASFPMKDSRARFSRQLCRTTLTVFVAAPPWWRRRATTHGG